MVKFQVARWHPSRAAQGEHIPARVTCPSMESDDLLLIQRCTLPGAHSVGGVDSSVC